MLFKAFQEVRIKNCPLHNGDIYTIKNTIDFNGKTVAINCFPNSEKDISRDQDYIYFHPSQCELVTSNQLSLF